MRGLHIAALILTIIGALNWGLIGLFNFNLVAAIFGDGTTASRIVYVLVGLAGLTLAVTAAAMYRTLPHDNTRRPVTAN